MSTTTTFSTSTQIGDRIAMEGSRVGPQHLLQLSEDQRRNFADSFDSVFSDIDGVLWTMKDSIPNSAEGYAALEKNGKQLTYVTNNSVLTEEQRIKRFAEIGMQVLPEQIWHPAKSIVAYLRGIDFQGLIYVIASPSFKTVLCEAGFQLLDGPNESIESNYASLAKHIFDQQEVRAVIIDVDFNLSYTKLARAHQYLRNQECLLIGGASDIMLPVAKDLKIMGPGSFANLLMDASGKKVITLGKPGRQLGDLLVRHYKIDQPRRVLMIGDMLTQDISFGRQCGFQTLLVLSGGCKLEQLMAEKDPSRIPDFYVDSIADLAQVMG
ncbi:pyridoxal phosphate phosphatase-like [Drosophila eugracilis]|uniref:pyridoxal phosphate phosphatase-like n=1 Tax=Drosophila eugracilis TaxID=29029 RepID=UPI0007E71AE7|nr:pyridoxal phosphate phosphatase-like [Drosophila eugracilis]